MKITHVRVSVLISGPGYNNSSCALEAELEDGDDYAAVADELRGRCKSQIKAQQEVERLWERVDEARQTVSDLEREIQRKRAEVEENRKIIRDHDRLVAICHREGIDPGALDNLPF